MSQGTCRCAEWISNHDSLTHHELQVGPVDELEDEEWHDCVHILGTVNGHLSVLAYSLIYLLNKQGGDQQNKEDTDVQED